MPIVSGREIAAARVLMRWRACDLAHAAVLHRNMVGHYEARDIIKSASTSNHGLTAIETAFRSAGVEFTTGGVRLINADGINAEAASDRHH